MSAHKPHQSQTHLHEHGPYCGHLTVDHGGHADYLHDGALHHVSGAKVEAHALDVDAKNPAACTPAHACGGHAADHKHQSVRNFEPMGRKVPKIPHKCSS